MRFKINFKRDSNPFDVCNFKNMNKKNIILTRITTATISKYK